MKEYFKLFVLILCDIFYLKKTKHLNKIKCRKNISDYKTVFVCIHEWGGYPLTRIKRISSDIVTFVCGLKYQLDRYAKYNGRYIVDVTVTMSDVELCENLDVIRSKCSNFLPVSNKGMDFSGYASFFDRIKDLPNSYVILSNSSVNAIQTDFIDSYIEYMDANKDVGMLGISCCSKCYQTLIRNNFNPHLQSFFLLTTISVLREVVEINNGKFPGVGISNKRLLIREGEIKLSQKVLALGYNLAVVTKDGPVKFNGVKNDWPMPLGDYRYYTNTPNAIYPIKFK